ncbi:MAG: prolyl oligopeptidase family serine peptidase [Gammaproteobacteria bacterium]
MNLMHVYARWVVVAGVAAYAAAAGAAPPPIEDLMRFPQFREVQLSPSGEYLAATVPDGDQTGVVILDLRDPENVHISAGIRVNQFENAASLSWANDNRLIFTSERQEGTLARPLPTGRIYAINADGTRGGQIYGSRGDMSMFRFANIIHRLPADPNHVLITDWAPGRGGRPLARRLNVLAQDRTINEAISPLERGILVADQQGRVRAAMGEDDQLRQRIAWRVPGGDDSAWQTFENPLGGDIRALAFDASGDYVYALSRNSNDLGLFRIELATGEFEKLLGDDTFEPTSYVWDRSRTEVLGAVFATPIPEIRYSRPDHPDARMYQALVAAFPTYQIGVGNVTDDGRFGVLRAASDREPGIFLSVDAETMRVDELVPVMPWLDPDELAGTRPVSFAARDGLEIHGYLTLPPGSDGRDMPLVVEVHGGPYGPYDRWTFDPWVQAMATRGYAVLRINFRGSGGRGAQFERNAYQQWGTAMQDDITDGTRWAIEQGIAHPDRICISGASYGGFAVLSGITREPDLYRCGFAFVGVYDLDLIRRTGNIPRSAGGREFLRQAVGTDDADLHARSPINFVDRIKAELFVAHGAADKQADASHYHALVRALEAADIPHEQMLVSREGHGFYLLENRVALYTRALALFERTIGAGWSPRE